MNKKDQSKYGHSILEHVYELSWEWLDECEPKHVIGTVELAQQLFEHKDIKKSAKMSYFNSLLGAGKFAKADGQIGRAHYWFPQTLQNYRAQLEQEFQQKIEESKKTQDYLINFDQMRKEMVRKLLSFDSRGIRMGYYKTSVLPALLDELENAPNEEAENSIINEITTLWKLCKMKGTNSLALAS